METLIRGRSAATAPLLPNVHLSPYPRPHGGLKDKFQQGVNGIGNMWISGYFVRLVVIWITLGGFASHSFVHAQTKVPIRGVNGETACALRDQLNAASCGTVSRRRDILSDIDGRAETFTPAASSCTCNTPFFNIWSACGLFESRWSTLPTLKEWKVSCQNANVAYRPVTADSIGSTKLPVWAHVKAPVDDATFDVAGVVLAATKQRWSVIQIVTPIISAVVILGAIGLFYLLFLRRRPDGSPSLRLFNKPARISHFLRPSRVRSEDPQGDWVIDRTEETLEAKPFPTTRPSTGKQEGGSGIEQQPRSGTPQPAFQPNRPGRQALPRSEPLSPQSSIKEEDNGFDSAEPPVQSKWSDSEHPSLAPWTSPALMKPTKPGLLPSVFKSIPNPFKGRPVRVQHVAPRAGFRLDDYDRRTESMLSRSAKSRADPEQWSVGASWVKDMDEDQVERATLISGEERENNNVFLISKNGRNFSLDSKSTRLPTPTSTVAPSSARTDSNINVVSPTASSLSWRTNFLSKAPPLPRLPLPPPPRRPPPTSPPSVPYDSTVRYPLANIPDKPVPDRKCSGSDDSSSSGKTLRPVAIDQTTGGPARPNLLLPPLRTVYESEQYPSTDSLHQPSHAHDHDAQDFDNDFLNLHPPRRPQLLDDDMSFYLGSTESLGHVNGVVPGTTMHLRTGSVETLNPRRSDPVMLFPASVRSAGYHGVPTSR